MVNVFIISECATNYSGAEHGLCIEISSVYKTLRNLTPDLLMELLMRRTNSG